jgi:hypothetical protein
MTSTPQNTVPAMLRATDPNGSDDGGKEPGKRDKRGRSKEYMMEIGKNTRFKPGNRANPRGRPKRDLDLAAEARKHAQSAIKALADIVNDTDAPPPSRISAASELLDRGYGTAPRSIDLNVSHGFSQELSQFLRRLHQEETGQIIENQGGSGLIAVDIEFDEVVEE